MVRRHAHAGPEFGFHRLRIPSWAALALHIFQAKNEEVSRHYVDVHEGFKIRSRLKLLNSCLPVVKAAAGPKSDLVKLGVVLEQMEFLVQCKSCFVLSENSAAESAGAVAAGSASACFASGS